MAKHKDERTEREQVEPVTRLKAWPKDIVSRSESTGENDGKDEAKQASALSSEPTPRPDPVGEHNYALSQPVVRPEGEGTPGPMHAHAQPAVPQEAHAQPEVREDAARKSAVTPVVPAVAPAQRVAPVVPPAPASPKVKTTDVSPQHPKHDARKK